MDINREIAEKVMGWHKPIMGKFWACDTSTPGEDDYTGFMQENAKFGEYWNPSERIDHAWMVVEKLRKQGYWVHLFGRPNQWSCTIIHLANTQKQDALQTADTAPMAICLAALEAVKDKP